jgi:hypothetical protein
MEDQKSHTKPQAKVNIIKDGRLVQQLMTAGDEDVSHGFPLKNIEQDPQAHNYTYERPMTRAKVKQLQYEVNLFLNDYEHASPKNHVLPNGGTLLVLRFEYHVLSNGGTLLILRFESQIKGGLNT